jgi:hypothetical protein
MARKRSQSGLRRGAQAHTVGAASADEGRHGGSGEDAVLTDDELGHAVSRRDLRVNESKSLVSHCVGLVCTSTSRSRPNLGTIEEQVAVDLDLN